MADWRKIKTEYITTNTSYRKLAEKYGIGYQAICARSRKEGWIEKREQHRNKTETKMLESICDMQVSKAVKIQGVADKLLRRVEQLLDDTGRYMDPQSMKHISGVLKDIKEINMVKSDTDIREQEARIAKLQKESEKDKAADRTVEIVFAGGDIEEWSG